MNQILFKGLSILELINPSIKKIKDIIRDHIITLVDRYHSKGKHIIPWDGNNSRGDQQTSGIYFYTINNENYSRKGKMILLK